MLTMRDELVEASGLRFTEAGLKALDRLPFWQFKPLIASLEQQERELRRLIDRDGEIYHVGEGQWPADPSYLEGQPKALREIAA